MIKIPVSDCCKSEVVQLKGTISRRWKCTKCGKHLGGDCMLDYKEVEEK